MGFKFITEKLMGHLRPTHFRELRRISKRREALIAELIAGGRAHAFGASAWTALALISSAAWAVSVRAGALSGGAVWLLGSLALLLSGKGVRVLGVIKAAEQGQASLRDIVVTGLLYPVTIPSLNLSTPAAAILLGVAAIALAGGVEYIARADFPIREEQG